MARFTAARGGVGLGVLAASADVATAHVEYVAEDSRDVADAVVFFVETVTDPVNAFLLFGGGLAVVVAALVYLRVAPFGRDIEAFRAAMAEYRDLVPWLLRISVGIPLVGAGFSGYLVSPAVPLEARIPQVTLGFLILFGLATRVAALAGLLAYLAGLVVYPELLFASEFVAGFAAIALVGPGRPSADHVLDHVGETEGTVYGQFDPVSPTSDRLERWLCPYEEYLPTVVRAGLGFNLVFLGAYEKLFRPGPALSVVEKYDLASVVPVSPEMWVVSAGFAEMAVGLAVLVGLFTRASAAVAFVLFSTTLFALPDDPVLAHVSLFGLVSVLLITGPGPLSADRRLLAVPDRAPRPTTT